MWAPLSDSLGSSMGETLFLICNCVNVHRTAISASFLWTWFPSHGWVLWLWRCIMVLRPRSTVTFPCPILCTFLLRIFETFPPKHSSRTYNFVCGTLPTSFRIWMWSLLQLVWSKTCSGGRWSSLWEVSDCRRHIPRECRFKRCTSPVSLAGLILVYVLTFSGRSR